VRLGAQVSTQAVASAEPAADAHEAARYVAAAEPSAAAVTGHQRVALAEAIVLSTDAAAAEGDDGAEQV